MMAGKGLRSLREEGRFRSVFKNNARFKRARVFFRALRPPMDVKIAMRPILQANSAEHPISKFHIDISDHSFSIKW